LALSLFEQRIWSSLREVGDLLIAKNKQYGDSAFDPLRIFSKADADAGLRIRIDDKLSRLARGNDSIESDRDIILDLIGYLTLLLLQMDEKYAVVETEEE